MTKLSIRKEILYFSRKRNLNNQKLVFVANQILFATNKNDVENHFVCSKRSV